MSWIERNWPRRERNGDPNSDRWGAIGAGWVLVVLPSSALFLGARYLDKYHSIGLPLLAVFGIMVLVGALALTSTLFRRLGLATRREPLGLPPGSVRATMALALIVLFAIIAIAAMRPSDDLRHLSDVSGTLRAELQRDPRITIMSGKLESCASRRPAATAAPAEPGGLIATQPAGGGAEAGCPAADERYSLVVRVGADANSQDLVKQLVLIIGQLMTMAVSFYFAARGTLEKADKSDVPPQPTPAPGPGPTPTPTPTPESIPVPPPAPTPSPPSPDLPTDASIATVRGPGPLTGTTFDLGAGPGGAAALHPDHEGCGESGHRTTTDEELPEARGGIARS
jgi:hypothetical protein